MRFSLLAIILLARISSIAQSNSGFKMGDSELVKFLERNLVSYVKSENDSSSYSSIAFLTFDNNGSLEKIVFMDDTYYSIKKHLNTLLFSSKDIWDKKLTKNLVLLIPIEVTIYDKNESVIPNPFMNKMSKEFLSEFKNSKSLKTILLEPIRVVSYREIKR